MAAKKEFGIKYNSSNPKNPYKIILITSCSSIFLKKPNKKNNLTTIYTNQNHFKAITPKNLKKGYQYH